MEKADENHGVTTPSNMFRPQGRRGVGWRKENQSRGGNEVLHTKKDFSISFKLTGSEWIDPH
jgi:hypothetical protein